MNTEMWCPRCCVSWSMTRRWRCWSCGQVGTPGELPNPCKQIPEQQRW